MASKKTADTIFVNGRVLTLNSQSSISQGLAVQGNRIRAVGGNTSMKRLAGRTTKIVDLKGKSMMPGFIDGHAHMDREGLKYIYPSLERARSIKDIQNIIRREVKRKKPGEWIITMPLGTPPYYDDAQATLKEDRLPNRKDLDAVAPDNPVYIKGAWSFWGEPPIITVANSLALKKAGIGKSTRSPHKGIRIEKEPRTGKPNGIFREYNLTPVLEHTLFKVVPGFTAKQRVTALRKSMRLYNEYGITSVYEGHGVTAEVMSAYRELWSKKQQTVRAYLALSPTWNSIAEAEDAIRACSLIAEQGKGDEWLKIGGMYIEYGGDSRLAKLRAQCCLHSDWAGFDYKANTPEEYRTLIELIAGNKIRINTYVGGDLEGPLHALEDLAKTVSLKQLRIVFVHLKIASPDQIKRMRKLNIHSTCTPFNHLCQRGTYLLNDNVNINDAVPLKGLLRAKIPAALSTDNLPFNPMETLWAAEARQDFGSGQIIAAKQRIPREELLRGFTSVGASLSFEEDLKGTLEPGKLADLVVLSEDPLKVSTEELRNIEVKLTMVVGKVVYQRN